jgi:hypothetical protein
MNKEEGRIHSQRQGDAEGIPGNWLQENWEEKGIYLQKMGKSL